MHAFSEEDNRVMANLDQVYGALKEVRCERLSLPRYMTWKTVAETRYLYQSIADGEKSLGRESAETVKLFDEFNEKKSDLDSRTGSMTKRLNSLMAQYKALNLPMVMALPAKILQVLDVHNLLGNEFLVVGSMGFAAYEMEAGCRFMDGIDETEDFDISWRASLHVSSNSLLDNENRVSANSLAEIIQSVDKSFLVSNFSRHKLVNKDAFEVDVLCSKGDHFKVEVADRDKIFGAHLEPVEMNGQDILHLGKPLRHIAVGRGGVASPLVVPDPRCMAIHKHWLSMQPDRLPKKAKKDGIQATLLWQQCNENMFAYPIDAEFLASLPNKWAKEAGDLSKKNGVDISELLPDVVLSGSYNGKVMDVIDGVVIQKIGRDPGKVIRHAIGNLSKIPAIGEVVDIHYRHERGEVGSRIPAIEME